MHIFWYFSKQVCRLHTSSDGAVAVWNRDAEDVFICMAWGTSNLFITCNALQWLQTQLIATLTMNGMLCVEKSSWYTSESLAVAPPKHSLVAYPSQNVRKRRGPASRGRLGICGRMIACRMRSVQISSSLSPR